ncbi:MAG: HEPN domain-containing protein [bacterium]
MEYSKIDLIAHRVFRARESADDAKIAIENNRLFNAENRIYYAIFYTVSALALKNDFSTSKHFQLLGWFNKNFVKTGIVSIELGQIYKKQFENRLESDYEDYVEFTPDEVKNDFGQMLKFVEEIEKLLK